MFPHPTTNSIQEVVLTRLRRECSMAISPEILESAGIILRDVPDKFARVITAFVDLPLEPLEEFVDTASFRTPKTWFDHFKIRFFSDYLLMRFPPQWHTETQVIRVKVGAVYPKLPEVFKKYGDVIRYHHAGNSPMTTYPYYKENESLD